MSNDPNNPWLTSGPSIPVHGQPARQPFGAGATPGRGARGANTNDNNPYAAQIRTVYGEQPGGGSDEPTGSFAPSLSLPTGGGALRSIGETFSANPFTGGGSMSVPIASTPGRNGFGPSLALSYSSGLGNGLFGLGWMLGVPAISRKTEKGLPEYRDRDPDLAKRDTFVLAGIEDLVHLLDEQGEVWEAVRDGHEVHRFLPRVEGGFSRVERWRSLESGDVHWKTVSPDNVTSYFGKTASARISDPNYPKHTFSWLLEESHDDRGNIVVYEYKQEDLEGVDQSAPEERPRLAENPTQAQRYLKRIHYGNAVPFVPGGWLFEVVLDYGEHGETPQAHPEQLDISPTELRPWLARPDTFSTHRAGFELRTRRLCRRVLMFHRFEAELGPAPYLVASTDFVHDEDPALTRLTGVVQRSYRRDEQTTFFEGAQLPTLELDYSPAQVDHFLHELTDPGTLRNLPAGIDGHQHRLVDLDGEGLPGIVVESAGTWYFRRGLGDGRFGAMAALPSRPTLIGSLGSGQGTQLLDIDGDGRKELVSFGPPTPGFFRRTTEEGWGRFQAFLSVPNIDWTDPRLQMIDLSGDGFADLLLDRGDRFVWYRSKGAEGFEAPRTVPNPKDQYSKPTVLSSSPTTSIQFADMTGDGLADLVRVRNGQVAYWANLGRGRFGPMNRMRGLSSFDVGTVFHPSRLRLVDVDGSGTTDVIYLGDRGAVLYRNLCGNAFAEGEELRRFPGVRSVDWAEVVDLKGTGTACLAWSTSLASGRGGVLRYIDLMGGQKPHLLVGSRNNMGAETKVSYVPSTKFYLADKAAGKPWLTKLPFPVQVVERVESIDHVSRQRFVSRTAYHHGYFDGQEREFRGFGLVETWDTESFEEFGNDGLFSLEQFDNIVEEGLHQPPVHTKTWFHTGAYLGRKKLSTLFAQEYWQGDAQAPSLPDARLQPGLTGAESREAVRALAGSTLRSEVFSLDGSEDEDKPYSVSEATFEVRQVQAPGPNRHGVYLALGRESLSLHYERDAADPRIAHEFSLEVDAYGTPLRTASVVYPRRSYSLPEQGALYVTLSESDVAHLDDLDDGLRLAVPLESRGYELHGLAAPANAGVFAWAAMRDAADIAAPIDFEATPTGVGTTEKRLLSRSRARYLADDLSAPLAYGSVESKALSYDQETMVMTDAQRTSVFGSLTGAPTNTELETEGGYLLSDAAWWMRSGHPTYSPEKFFQVTSVTDPYNNTYTTTYDAHALLTIASADPLGNTTSVEHDYRLLAPWQLTTPNGNRTHAAFDILGFVEKTAIMGKAGDSDGDTLLAPTSTFEYDLFEWQTTGAPNWAKSRVRETHADPNTAWLEQRTYFSGGGGTLMVKAQTRPGLAPQRDAAGALILDGEGKPVLADTSPNLRWVGNGRTILDNKGQVLKAYEPYFSSTPEFEDEAELVEQGVTALNHYDPLGRLVRTDFPNATHTKVQFSPWTQTSWDVNDTVLDSPWYAERISYQGADVDLLAEKRAAQLAAKHANTPSVVHLDTLGRPFLSIAHNIDPGETAEHLETRTTMDIAGNILEVEDARGNIAETRTYGMLGQSLTTESHDAGARRHLLTALGQPMRSWDDRNQRFSHTYDALRRMQARTVSESGGPEKLLERIVYGHLLDTPKATNHVGRVYRIYDGAGVATTEAFDFKGNPISEKRQLVSDKKTRPDWSALLTKATVSDMATAATALLDAEIFEASSTRDALNRVLTAVSPDDSTASYTYDEGGSLEKVELQHRGSTTTQTIVGDIAYDARGQRESVVYGSTTSPTTSTAYSYDPETYRLASLETIRGSDSKVLQELAYHYDPVGNITDIRDAAQQTVYFQNAVVSAANSYEYDALYRLVAASGREHSTQGTTQRTHVEVPVGTQPMSSDPSAMRRYTQEFRYDEVGNITEMKHIPSGGTGWTRRYQYATAGNRMLATSSTGDAPGAIYTDSPTYAHTYTYDTHGSMTVMPHISSLVWNSDDEMQQAAVGTETVYFQYAGGSRTRKFVEKSGSTTEERIYLGPWELYRKEVNSTLNLERETLHISDGTGRICMVETKTVSGGTTVSNPVGIWRYQLGNHLGSAATEVDASGGLISYEEYHPYGTSSYRAVDSSIDVSAKRYRYTGMERDEETGLAYHSARYLVPWLGRWCSADPIGLEGGLNRFPYTNNPIGALDTSGTSPSTYSSERPAPLGPSSTGEWNRVESGDPIYEESAEGEFGEVFHWEWNSVPLEPKEEFLARKDRQVTLQNWNRQQEVLGTIAEQNSQEFNVADLTLYGSMMDGRMNFENAVDAALAGDYGTTLHQSGWGVVNTSLTILDVLTFGGASAATKGVVHAEARQTGRTVAKALDAESNMARFERPNGDVDLGGGARNVTDTVSAEGSASADLGPSSARSAPEARAGVGGEAGKVPPEAPASTPISASSGKDQGVKLTGKGRRMIGNLRELKDVDAAVLILRRGGNGSNVRKALGDQLKGKTVGEIANLAATGDPAAKTALKIIKQAGKKGQKY